MTLTLFLLILTLLLFFACVAAITHRKYDLARVTLTLGFCVIMWLILREYDTHIATRTPQRLSSGQEKAFVNDPDTARRIKDMEWASTHQIATPGE